MHPLLGDLAARGARHAIRADDGTVSYAELARLARVHATRLREAGVGPGDRVAVWATPHVATVAAILGDALAGVATVPLNPALGEAELRHVLADAGPRAVFAAEPAAFRARTPTVAPIPLDGNAGPLTPSPAPSDTFLVVYTSGTTGPPKGAGITHAAAAFDLDALAGAWAWTEADVLVHALPLFHVHGLLLGVVGALRVGGTLRLLPRFTPEGVCAAMGCEGTMLFAVPTMYHRLAEHCEATPGDAARLGRARLLVSGSAALPVRENERLHRLLGQRPVERYGLTETLILCAARHDGPRTPGTVGPPLPGVALRLVDEQRRPLPSPAPRGGGGPGTSPLPSPAPRGGGGPGTGPAPDSIGEIAVKAPCVFDGYLNRPDATAAAMDGGYFHTGDLAEFTPEGEVRIVGRRATDLIKTGGFKVGAGEVEAALLEHPEVAEAAVIGVPDEDLGERIVAFVVAARGALPTGEALAEHVARLLAPHKRPRAVRLVEALPRNAMGKVLKKKLSWP